MLPAALRLLLHAAQIDGVMIPGVLIASVRPMPLSEADVDSVVAQPAERDLAVSG